MLVAWIRFSDQVGEEREADGHQAPEDGEPLRGGDVVRVGWLAR